MGTLPPSKAAASPGSKLAGETGVSLGRWQSTAASGDTLGETVLPQTLAGLKCLKEQVPNPC